MSKKDLFRNQIFTLENFLSPVECAEYINFTENLGYTDAPISTNKGFEMWQRISNYIPKIIHRRCAVGVNKRFRFYKYSPGQGLHKDKSMFYILM